MNFQITFEYENTNIVDVVNKTFADFFDAEHWSEKEKIARGAKYVYIQ